MKLAVAVPARSQVETPFANDLALMYATTCASVPVVTLMVGFGFVHQSRENLLHDATLWGATHVLWLDTDMRFPPDTALRLLKHDADIVAANYVTRVPPFRPTARRDGRCISSHDATGLEAVDHVGMGVFLMKTSVVAGLPCPEIVEPATGRVFHPRFWYSSLTETEDVYFCRLLRAAGHEIWIDHDLSKEVGHVGQYTYRHVPMVKPKDTICQGCDGTGGPSQSCAGCGGTGIFARSVTV